MIFTFYNSNSFLEMFFIALPLTTQPPWNMKTPCFSDDCNDWIMLLSKVVYSFMLYLRFMNTIMIGLLFSLPPINLSHYLCIAQDPVALILKAGELPATGLRIIHQRGKIQIYWLSYYDNEICLQRLAPVDLQKTVTEFPSHCCQDSSLFLLWQVKAW